jgi:colanic acid/amylovoran biosynthesis glycosyltransferase
VKLLYVTGGFPRTSETFVLNEVVGQLERGHDVRVVSLRSADSVPEADRLRDRVVSVGRVPVPRRLPRHGAVSVPDARPARRLFAVVAATEVAGRLGGWVPDVVHAHFLNLPTVVAGALGRLLGVPSTFTGHADDFLVGVPDRVLRQRVLFADAGFVVSEWGRQEITRRAGLDEAESGRLAVVRAAFRRRADPRTPGVAGPPTLVTVARLVPIKGVDVSIRAFAGGVRRHHPEARYDIVGDGPERGRLEALARSLGLGTSVTFHGPLGNAEAQEVVRRASVALLACRTDVRGAADGVPVFLMEAGALGVPVVSTPVAGVPELVADGSSGVLVPADDERALADAVLRVAGDPALGARLTEGLQARLATDFSPARQLERMQAVWERAVGHHR